MQKRPLKNIALLGFLIGILFIVFILFITSRNINQLINSNQALLNELRTRNDLRKMEADLLSVESDIRGAVISANPEFLNDVEEKIQHIDNALVRVNKELRSSITSGEVERLMSLVNRKVEFSREILDAFEKKGKPAAEAIINSGTGKLMRDSIVQIITVLDQSRQQKSLQITNTIKKSGSEAKISGAIMAILASILLVFAFWYILNLSTGQQRMISDLNISEKRLKEASSMKEQFMVNMSHEIRTPMNAIIGFTNILKRTDLDPEQRQYVQNIHSSGENLLALINDILDLSKIEAGMLQFEETNFSLRSITSSVGAMFTEKIKEKQLSYRGEIASDVPDILSGDAI
ncbi:MAG TPA: histidine kinase dimerization/phospho-acceptor domain-containing protein, partial [Chitinophagaceae bacterium]|nr:histidine kinase dimerization/phospho-acceptor domain-containing protein [Chitinophagaceae bacterium]